MFSGLEFVPLTRRRRQMELAVTSPEIFVECSCRGHKIWRNKSRRKGEEVKSKCRLHRINGRVWSIFYRLFLGTHRARTRISLSDVDFLREAGIRRLFYRSSQKRQKKQGYHKMGKNTLFLLNSWLFGNAYQRGNTDIECEPI